MKWTSACVSVGLACLSALTLGAQTKQSSIGREVSVPRHLQDGEEFSIPLPALLVHGLLLFNATWTEQEGGGRPLTKGTGRPLADPSRPLTGNRAFNRLSAPDAGSCAACHNAPYGIVGGGGDFVTKLGLERTESAMGSKSAEQLRCQCVERIMPVAEGRSVMWSLVRTPLIAAVLLCAMPCAVSAQEGKYQTVLYPKGMLPRKGWDGKERPALYHFLADVELTGKQASVVLYSEETVTGASDNVFTVFLGLVRTRNGVSQSQATIDLTKYVPVYVESPGNFHHVTGALNRFMATPNLTAVHVNLWAV